MLGSSWGRVGVELAIVGSMWSMFDCVGTIWGCVGIVLRTCSGPCCGPLWDLKSRSVREALVTHGGLQVDWKFNELILGWGEVTGGGG